MNLPYTVLKSELEKIFENVQDCDLHKSLINAFCQIEQVETYGCYNVQDHQVIYIKTKSVGKLRSQKEFILKQFQKAFPQFDIQDVDIYS